MKIDRIAVEQLWPTGSFANVRYRAEATIEPHEDLVECFRELQKKAEASFISNNPQIKWDCDRVIPINDEPKQFEQPISQEQALIELINSKYQTPTTLKNLKPKIEAANNDKVTAAYELKLQSLQNK